jgi:hypothetical protein
MKPSEVAKLIGIVIGFTAAVCLALILALCAFAIFRGAPVPW